MNKKEFLNALQRNIDKLPKDDQTEIIFDYEEHFTIGISEGRTEEEIASSLGNPNVIAKQLKANHMITRAEANQSVSNIMRALLATGALGFLNLFVLIGFLVVIIVLLALFIAGLSVTVSGLLIMIASIVEPFNQEAFNLVIHPVVGIFASIGVTMFGLLWNIAIYYLSKLFYNLVVRYLKLNIKIITNK